MIEYSARARKSIARLWAVQLLILIDVCLCKCIHWLQSGSSK